MQNGDYEKIVEYIVTNQDKFYRLAFSYVRNQQDALDIVQNSICKALENYESIRELSAVRTWFYRIIVNESINFMKKSKKEFLEMDEFFKNIAYNEEQYEGEDELLDEINKLDTQVQHIIKLRFYEELSLQEIAAITKMNLNTVKAKLYRGLKALKLEIGEVSI